MTSSVESEIRQLAKKVDDLIDVLERIAVAIEQSIEMGEDDSGDPAGKHSN